MASRSLNKVFLIGNLTRDPELRYTPQGTPVCSLGLATNRSFVTDGERREETEFHKLVAWNKLAELCSQLLKKGIKIHIEGRLQTRSWQTPDGQQRQTTEIVVEDMMILTPKGAAGEAYEAPADEGNSYDRSTARAAADDDSESREKKAKKEPAPSAGSGQAKKKDDEEKPVEDDIDDLEIPF